jgi:hypothetical protein
MHSKKAHSNIRYRTTEFSRISGLARCTLLNKISDYFQAAEIDRLQNDSSQWDSSSIAALSSQLAKKKK